MPYQLHKLINKPPENNTYHLESSNYRDTHQTRISSVRMQSKIYTPATTLGAETFASRKILY